MVEDEDGAKVEVLAAMPAESVRAPLLRPEIYPKRPVM